jgi:hypothetical protein
MLLAGAAILCVAVLTPKVIVIAQACWYRYFRYPSLRRRMDLGDRPHVRVFVPCHGGGDGLDANFDALAVQEYTPFDVVCVAESGDDPAIEAIERARRRHPGVIRLSVADGAVSCSQKNHNLLTAIRRHPVADVYLFCDAKVRPRSDWIARMIEPFTLRPAPLAVTALCSRVRYRGWSLPHALQQQVACWQSAALMSFVGGVWGASMAVRRSDFDRLGIDELWSKTVVDDSTLFSSLLAGGRSAMVASNEARPEAGYEIRGMGDFFDWGVRQLQYVHHCLPRYRLPMLLRNLGTVIAVVWPLALATGHPGSDWYAVGMLSLGLFAVDTGINLLAKPIAELPLPWRWHLLAAPFWELQWTVLSVAAVLRDTVEWRGVEYSVDRCGRVTAIRRREDLP